MRESLRMIVCLFVLISSSGRAAAGQIVCHAEQLRAMTYNIRLDTPADGTNAWANRRGLFVSQIQLVRPDVLGLQEVLPGQRSDLVADLPGYLVIGGGRDDGNSKGEASPLLIDRQRFKLVEHGMFWLSPTPDKPSTGWNAAYPRVATWAKIIDRKSRKKFFAINTHWDHVSLDARRESAILLDRWIKAHQTQGEQIVLLGDFNAVTEEPSLQWLSAKGWRDALIATQNAPAGGLVTFNGWSILPQTSGAIDHIFVTASTTVLRYQVLAAHFDGRLASDHFAVIADLAPVAAKGCAAKPPA